MIDFDNYLLSNLKDYKIADNSYQEFLIKTEVKPGVFLIEKILANIPNSLKIADKSTPDTISFNVLTNASEMHKEGFVSHCVNLEILMSEKTQIKGNGI